MHQKIRKLIDLQKSHGLAKTLVFSWEALQERFFALFYERIKDIVTIWDLTDEKKIKRYHQLSIEEIDKNTLPGLMAFCDEHHLSSQIKSKLHNYLDNGFSGFILKQNAEMIGFMWWVDNQLPVKQNHPSLQVYDISLDNDEVYMFDNFLAPAFRGNANAIQFLILVREQLTKMGYKKAIAYVRANNRPARWVYAVQGWKNEGDLVRHKILRVFLIANGRLFIKNHRLYSQHTFEYRPLVFTNLRYRKRDSA